MKLCAQHLFGWRCMTSLAIWPYIHMQALHLINFQELRPKLRHLQSVQASDNGPWNPCPASHTSYANRHENPSWAAAKFQPEASTKVSMHMHNYQQHISWCGCLTGNFQPKEFRCLKRNPHSVDLEVESHTWPQSHKSLKKKQRKQRSFPFGILLFRN